MNLAYLLLARADAGPRAPPSRTREGALTRCPNGTTSRDVLLPQIEALPRRRAAASALSADGALAAAGGPCAARIGEPKP